MAVHAVQASTLHRDLCQVAKRALKPELGEMCPLGIVIQLYNSSLDSYIAINKISCIALPVHLPLQST